MLEVDFCAVDPSGIHISDVGLAEIRYIGSDLPDRARLFSQMNGLVFSSSNV